MAQQIKVWQSGDSDRRWLSMLVDAMERVSREKTSRREARATRCDPRVLSALRLQLARPASPYPYWHARQLSRFSLLN